VSFYGVVVKIEPFFPADCLKEVIEAVVELREFMRQTRRGDV